MSLRPKPNPGLVKSIGNLRKRPARKIGLSEATAEVPRKFGENLVELRRGIGLSQQGTAERAGLDRGEVSLLERGLRTPRLDTIVKLAGALEVQPCVLLVEMAIEFDPPKGGSK